MRERILELAELSDVVAVNKTMTGAKQYTFLEEDLLRFSELIVRECVDVVREGRWFVPPTQEQIANAIKRHFDLD